MACSLLRPQVLVKEGRVIIIWVCLAAAANYILWKSHKLPH